MAVEEEISLTEPSLPNLTFTEIGYNGLSVINGRVLEECNYELQWPHCVKTFKDMAKDGTIAPAIDYVQKKIGKVPWNVKAPKGYEEELKNEVLFLQTVMRDMDHSWPSFIKETASFAHLGFCIHEIVPRKRLKIRGSRFNDGFIGIKKLALRSQDTIIGWNYKNKGRDLKSIVQKVNKPSNRATYGNLTAIPDSINSDNMKSEKEIPLSKCLHFKNNPQKGNPLGLSPLIGCWRAWKFKQAYEEAESNGVSADVHGFKKLTMPSHYMTESASDDQKATFEHFKKALRNMSIGKESGILIPSDTDDAGKPLVDFEVVSITGSKSYDIDKIIRRYQDEIRTGLYSTFLSSGNGGGGSFALSDNLKALADEIVETILEEVRDVLNHKLIPYIFELNGWETEVYPTFEFGAVTKPSLDELGKYFQRTGAIGGLAFSAVTVNEIMEFGGLSFRLPEDLSPEEVREWTGKAESKAGQGMETDMPSGTGSSLGNNSATNNNNAE